MEARVVARLQIVQADAVMVEFGELEAEGDRILAHQGEEVRHVDPEVDVDRQGAVVEIVGIEVAALHHLKSGRSDLGLVPMVQVGEAEGSADPADPQGQGEDDDDRDRAGAPPRAI